MRRTNRYKMMKVGMKVGKAEIMIRTTMQGTTTVALKDLPKVVNVLALMVEEILSIHKNEGGSRHEQRLFPGTSTGGSHSILRFYL
jgi:hypothetical protein